MTVNGNCLKRLLWKQLQHLLGSLFHAFQLSNSYA
jgi:hypothetical protein